MMNSKLFFNVIVAAVMALLFSITACGNQQNNTQSDVTIGDIFMALPDSLGIDGDRQLMLEGGTALDSVKMTYDEQQYPNGVAVEQGNYLYWYIEMMDGVWDMCMWDTNNSNEKLVLLHQGSVVTQYAYFFRYHIDTKTFEPAQDVFPLPTFEDMVNEEFLETSNLKPVQDFYNSGAKWWGNSTILFILPSSDDCLSLSLSDIVLENCEYVNNRNFALSKVLFKWNGEKFEQQLSPSL